MEIEFMKWYFLILIITETTLGSVNRKKDELTKYRSEVIELGARLSTLEKEIGSKNNLYISSIEQIKQFEVDVSLYRARLIEVQKEVHDSQQQNKKILQSYLAQGDSEGVEDWQMKAHLELLKQAQAKLKNKEAELASFEAKVTDFDAKLASLKATEEELSQMILELESRKKTTMEKYLAKLENKKKIESKVNRESLQKKLEVVKKTFSDAPVLNVKPDRIFDRPVDDFITFAASAKGVTFKYNSIQPVKAVASGKVVFAGDLASYGQVVLIDHGNDLRTVLLGKMNIKVEKNQNVTDGDVVAYTLNDGADAQNLYFEVRKKNTAQNTILWLDSSGVSKI